MSSLFPQSSYAAEAEIGANAVRQAARLCRAVQASIAPDTLEKKDKSPVTIADFASQALVCQALHEAFPDDPIIAEEDAKTLRGTEMSPFLDRIVSELALVEVRSNGSAVCDWIDRGRTTDFQPRFWTLDPIDGTKGFLRGEQYAISLALIVDGHIEIGLLGCPNLSWERGDGDETDVPRDPTGSLFIAIRGEGAQVLPLDGSTVEPRTVRTQGISDPALARLCESVESGHSAHSESARIAQKLGISRSPIRLDSQAKYATVADGRADIYLRLPTRADYVEKIWDHAGGVLVVQEAGGTVTDIHGKPLEFTHGRGLNANQGVVATAGTLHEQVLAAIRQVRDGG